MNDEKVKGKIQDAKTRVKNFDEVELGYTKEEALKEANRCLHCLKPRCVEGCPVGIMIPEFIKCIKEDNIEGAYEVISQSSSLPAICGRVCPQEKQCEAMCIKGIKGDAISIGTLERFVADYMLDKVKYKKPKSNGKKVAVVGSGPSGLSCAYDLAKEGFEVTIFEILHKAGGVLTYGIPEFRLPKAIVEKQIDSLRELGVEIICDVLVGNTITLEELQKEYDAVFLGTGAGLPKFMDIPGEDANGVFSANEILTRINLMGSFKDDSKTPIKKVKKAYVIGGGNVAMDAVRSLKRLGIDAHIMYRRGEEELPARLMEVHHAKEEGIVFDLLTNPKEILVDENNNVIGMNVVNMLLTEPGEDGRRGVEEDPKSLHKVDCDMVVMALGTSPNHSALKNSKIELSDRGLIVVENSKTSLKNVYAGGDAVTGAATVILAMEAGKKAAAEIIEKIK
jgi:glutamate synthase (NADPH/NADH) small chain